MHAKRDLSDCTRSLALEVLNEDYGQVSTELLLTQVKHFRLWSFGTCSPFSGLHCASFFGIEVVAVLIEAGCYDINKEDFSGCTPLSWAARSGHGEAVNFSPVRGELNPDKPDKDGRTPLSCAASAGHEGVVEILLEREEVNPDKPDNNGKTPFSYAAQSGHKGVVKILLEREEVNPDKPDNDGRTPLSLAAEYGRERVVALLQPHKVVPLPVVRFKVYGTPPHRPFPFGVCYSWPLSLDPLQTDNSDEMGMHMSSYPPEPP